MNGIMSLNPKDNFVRLCDACDQPAKYEYTDWDEEEQRTITIGFCCETNHEIFDELRHRIETEIRDLVDMFEGRKSYPQKLPIDEESQHGIPEDDQIVKAHKFIKKIGLDDYPCDEEF